MSDELFNALAGVLVRLQDEVPAHCVEVTVHFNHEGCNISYTLRSPGSLRRDGISMRNLCGDWVE
jgi:hypothetical protein